MGGGDDTMQFTTRAPHKPGAISPSESPPHREGKEEQSEGGTVLRWPREPWEHRELAGPSAARGRPQERDALGRARAQGPEGTLSAVQSWASRLTSLSPIDFHS